MLLFIFEDHKHYTVWSFQKVCEALSFRFRFVLDLILFMRVNSGYSDRYKLCSLVADLFLFCYKRNFMFYFFIKIQSNVIEAFALTSQYLDDF